MLNQEEKKIENLKRIISINMFRQDTLGTLKYSICTLKTLLGREVGWLEGWLTMTQSDAFCMKFDIGQKMASTSLPLNKTRMDIKCKNGCTA